VPDKLIPSGQSILVKFDWMSVLKNAIKTASSAALILGMISFAGCSVNGGPRMRMGSYPASSLPTKFMDANGLGSHSYGNGLFEHNGLVYTARGGHIDIAHLRIAADNTRNLSNKAKTHLLNSDTDFYFKLNVEPSQYHVTLVYPAYWKNLPEKYREKIAGKLSPELGQYFTYTMTTWHEVLTWFGFKCLFFLPEKKSAFSWEDIYSNLLGTRLGALALADKEHEYNEAMTILLNREMQELQIQPRATAIRAAKEMKNKYFDGQRSLDRTRSMDIGLYDGYVTPVLVPGICSQAKPKSYPVPTLELLEKYGFSLTLEIHPKEFESGKILKIIYPDGSGKSIYPDKQLPIVMSYVENDAIKQGFAIKLTQKPEIIVSAK
jgi:hypothetical protein